MDIYKLIKEMTLKEKIAQLTQISFNFKNFEEVKEKIENYQVGSLILGGSAFVGDGDEAAVEKHKIRELQKAATENTRLGIPLLFGRDVIHGHETIFPVNLAMAASFNPELLRLCYDKIREEAAYDGINWTFCPMLDFCHDPRWGRIIECQGEDPYLASKLAEAIVKGFQTDSLSNEGAVAACAKHYIGYGASEGGRDYNHTEISDYALWNNYIPAFRSAVDSGVATVMNSFNEMNGIPVAASRRLLTDILRGRLGFDGFVISDWGAISQLKNHCMAENDADAAELALKAGIDMDMVDDCYFNHLEKLVASGRISEELINLSVERVLKIKDKMGLFEKPIRSFSRPDIKENAKLAGKMCAETAVLLKNEGNLLPLDKSQRITVTGPFAGVVGEHSGSWVILTEAYKPQSFIDAIRAYAPNTRIEYKDNLASSYLAARNSDVVICALGEPPYVTGEMHSVSSIEIPEAQKQLLIDLKKQGKKIVGLLFFGRPVALQSVEPFMDAILYAMLIVIIVTIWSGFGVGFLSFISGLQSLDRSYYEAAAIDGLKNRWQELYYVTLPQIGPQLLFGAVMTITNAFSAGAISRTLTGFPSPGYSTHTMVLHISDYGSIRYEMGYASALSMILFILMLVSWLLVNKLLRRFNT